MGPTGRPAPPVRAPGELVAATVPHLHPQVHRSGGGKRLLRERVALPLLDLPEHQPSVRHAQPERVAGVPVRRQSLQRGAARLHRRRRGVVPLRGGNAVERARRTGGSWLRHCEMQVAILRGDRRRVPEIPLPLNRTGRRREVVEKSANTEPPLGVERRGRLDGGDVAVLEEGPSRVRPAQLVEESLPADMHKVFRVIRVIQVEPPAVGCLHRRPVTGAAPLSPAAQDRVAIVLRPRTAKVPGTRDLQLVAAVPSAAGLGRVEQVVPALALDDRLPFIPSLQERKGLAAKRQTVRRHLARQECRRDVVVGETVRLPREVEPAVVVLEGKAVDRLFPPLDDDPAVGEALARIVRGGDADHRDVVGLPPRRVVDEERPVVMKELGRPVARGGPLRHAVEDVPELLPVHQIPRDVERVIRRPFGRRPRGVVRVADADHRGIGEVARDDGVPVRGNRALTRCRSGHGDQRKERDENEPEHAR